MAKDGILLLWVTSPKLNVAVHLLKGWGLEFVTVLLVWTKIYRDGKHRVGLGHYTRSCCEYLLLCRRVLIARTTMLSGRRLKLYSIYLHQ